jgi:hypothetical protein
MPRMTDEELADAQDRRRHRADAKAHDRMMRRETEAETMIGEIVREGRPVLYINLRDRRGVPTGKTKEGSRLELVAYLLRNGYA